MSQRSNRAEETRRARRMKPGDVAKTGIRLGVDDSRLDPDKTYRWVKDDPARIAHMHKLDYDLVDEPVKEDSNGLGTIPSAHGGIGENGKPYGMVLMAKFKDWYADDQKEKQKPLDEIDNSIRRGTAHQKSGEADNLGAAYTPEGITNTVSR